MRFLRVATIALVTLTAFEASAQRDVLFRLPAGCSFA